MKTNWMCGNNNDVYKYIHYHSRFLIFHFGVWNTGKLEFRFKPFYQGLRK